MTRELDAFDRLSEGGDPDADRRLAENFGMTVRQVQEFDPQTLDVKRACKFLGLPPKRFDLLAAQPAERGRWVESIARQRKDLIEMFPEAGKDLKEVLESIRKFALRKCLNPEGPASADGGETERAGSRLAGRGSSRWLYVGGALLAAAAAVCGGLFIALAPTGDKSRAERVAAPPAPAAAPPVNRQPDPPRTAAPSPPEAAAPTAVATPTAKVGPGPGAPTDPDRAAAAYVYSVGGVVRINSESATRKPDQLPKEPFRLTSAIIREGGRVTDEGLRAFQGCRHIRVVTILKAPVTAGGLSHFRDSNDIITIALSGPHVDDAAVSCFSRCEKLRQLWIGGPKITDKGVAGFYKLKGIEYLDLNSSAVTDAGVAGFAGAPTLKFLSLDQTAVGDAGLAAFKECKNLETLHLEGARVTDKSIPTLEGFARLKSIKIKKTGITTAGAKRLAKALPNCKFE